MAWIRGGEVGFEMGAEGSAVKGIVVLVRLPQCLKWLTGCLQKQLGRTEQVRCKRQLLLPIGSSCSLLF